MQGGRKKSSSSLYMGVALLCFAMFFLVGRVEGDQDGERSHVLEASSSSSHLKLKDLLTVPKVSASGEGVVPREGKRKVARGVKVAELVKRTYKPRKARLVNAKDILARLQKGGNQKSNNGASAARVRSRGRGKGAFLATGSRVTRGTGVSGVPVSMQCLVDTTSGFGGPEGDPNVSQKSPNSFFLHFPQCKIDNSLSGSQGACNSCYAHAAATHMTHFACARAALAGQAVDFAYQQSGVCNGGSVSDTPGPGKLSAQQIVDCGPGTGCTQGGNAIDVLLWVADNFINPRSCPHGGGYVADTLPSPGRHPTCDTTACPGAVSFTEVMSDYVYVPSVWKQFIFQTSIVATMSLYPDFDSFTSVGPNAVSDLGVYTCPQGVSPTFSHWVVLVGYGTDPNSSIDYWVIENSWGNMYAQWKGSDGGLYNPPAPKFGPFLRATQDQCLGWGSNGNIWGAASGEIKDASGSMHVIRSDTITTFKSQTDVTSASNNQLLTPEDIDALQNAHSNNHAGNLVYGYQGSGSKASSIKILPGGG